MKHNNFNNPLENFINIQPRNERSPEKISPSPSIDRRSFLKYGAAIAGIASMNALFADTKERSAQQSKDISSAAEPNDQTDDAQKELAALRAQLHASAEQQLIHENDQSIIGKTFRQQVETQNRISLDKAAKDAIYDHWHRQYESGGVNHRDGLVAGLNRMQPWTTEIRAIFRSYGIPEEYMYLAIAESHFDTNAISYAHAVGPYQITPDTARRFNLIITDTYDERRDPIKSAELCAKHLQYSYEKFDHDWSLALMDYNGGFTKKYLEYIVAEEEKKVPKKQCAYAIQEGDTLSSIAQRYNTSVTLLANINRRKNDTFDVSHLKKGQEIDIPEKRQITIEQYNLWLEGHINSIIEKTHDHVTHTVRIGETLEEIAQKYYTTPQRIMENNNMKNLIITAQQNLTISIPQEKRVDILLDILSSYQENINYPEKFYAIRDIIRDNNLANETLHDASPYHKENVPRTSQKTMTETLQKNDSYGKAVRRLYTKIKKRYPSFDKSLAVVERMIIQQNKITKPEKIPANTALTLTIPINTPPSLKEFAQNRSIPLDALHKINPAIYSDVAELPTHTTIRIPKK